MISKAEIDELCRQHDELMAQAREAERSGYVQRNDPGDGLIFKDNEDAMVPAYTPEPDGFSEYQGDVLAHLIVELRDEWETYIDRRIAALQGENAELKGMIGAVLQLLGKRGGDVPKSGGVVELLPNWRKKRDVA
jgi:hypothetical protein